MAPNPTRVDVATAARYRAPVTASAWVFDPLPPSGAISGGTAANYVFAPTIDIFVREVLQNAHDQRLPTPGFAQVDIDVMEFTGEHRRRIFEAMSFDGLRAHLDGIAGEPYKLGAQVRDALARLDGGAPLRVLRVTDRHTEGLTGGEDEKGTNFNSLCRDVLVNTDQTAGKGGSYGLGKAVLWRFSAISTVLFASRIDVGGATRLRAFGRADLAHHATASGRWAGPGWFGIAANSGSGRRAESLWDDAAAELAGAIGGHAAGSDETGSCVAVVDFLEPGADAGRSAGEIALAIAEAAERWFWPAATASPPTLRVAVGVETDGVPVSRIEVDMKEGASGVLVDTARANPTDHAVDPGEVASRLLPFVVPARRDGSARETEAVVELRVRRADAEEADADGAGRVALVRGAGMVVEHRRPRRAPSDGGAFHAVLLAGLARADTPADRAVEAFLRSAEPPAHNRWVHDTDMIRSGYVQGARKQLDALWRAIDDALVDMADPEVPTREPGPPALAKMFAVGTSGTGVSADHAFDVRPSTGRLVDDVWTVSFRTRRLAASVPWRVDVSVWLDADSGRGEPMPVTEFGADVLIDAERLAPHHFVVDTDNHQADDNHNGSPQLQPALLRLRPDRE